MSSSTQTSGTDDNAVTVEVPAWEAEAGGVGLLIEGQAAVRRRNASADRVQSQLICHFSRITVPSSENAHFTIRHPFDHFFHRHTWEEATRQMFSTVAADHVRPADLELLALAFSMYTFSVFDRLPIGELAEVEISTVIKVPAAPATSSSHLRIFVPMEEFRYLSSGSDAVDMDDMESNGGACRPASAAAVNDLQIVTPEEPGSCSICLDDFNAVSTRVLAMPCRHLFHEVCLKEWLLRSNSCPICRFSLPVAAE